MLNHCRHTHQQLAAHGRPRGHFLPMYSTDRSPAMRLEDTGVSRGHAYRSSSLLPRAESLLHTLLPDRRDISERVCGGLSGVQRDRQTDQFRLRGLVPGARILRTLDCASSAHWTLRVHARPHAHTQRMHAQTPVRRPAPTVQRLHKYRQGFARRDTFALRAQHPPHREC